MITKTVLAKLNKCYSIEKCCFENRMCIIAATEGREGEAVLIDCVTNHATPVIGFAGGVMNWIPIKCSDNAFFAIQRFYPVFDSENAEIVYVELKRCGEVIEAEMSVLTKFPFVHRIAILDESFPTKFVAASLCTAKADRDDWSQGGVVVEFTLSQDNRHILKRRTLAENLHKNHGMFQHRCGIVYIGAEEGLFSYDYKTKGLEKLLDIPVSDVFMCDLDDCGQDEIIIISPFHGNSLKIFKKVESDYQFINECALSFGHAIWAGKLHGEPIIIHCSRSADKRIELVHLGHALNIKMVETIDSNVGPSNIVVSSLENEIRLYSANREEEIIALYNIT